jgi:hypothetical protein
VRIPNRRLRVALVALLAFVLLVLVLPLALVVPGRGGIDPARVSEVAALYGVASTIVSGIALCGVALSILFQAQANRSSAYIATREQHTALMLLSMNDAELAACWSGATLPPGGPSDRQLTYANLIFAFWEMQWETGTFDDGFVSRHAALTLKESAIARRYWRNARIARIECGCDRSPFYRLVDAQYQRLATDESAPTEPAASPPGRPVVEA